MTRKNSVALAVLFFVVTSLSFQPVSAQRGGDQCEFSADITAELAATSEELIRIEAGSGSLTVEGQAGLSAVRVTGIACASDEWMLEELRVSLERRGSTLELETFHPRDSRGRNTYARINLQVDVPYGYGRRDRRRKRVGVPERARRASRGRWLRRAHGYGHRGIGRRR